MLIKQLTAETQALMQDTLPEIRHDQERIYEAFRYSDPVSDEMVFDINMKIEREFAVLKDAVLQGDVELTHSQGANMLALIKERNIICKASK